MVAYITHDQTSPDNRRPTTSERVAWSACLGIPTNDTDLMVRAMQGLTADAPALKALAGISARGRQSEEAVHAPRAELAGGDRGPDEAGHAVGRRRRPEEHPPRRPPLRGLRRPDPTRPARTSTSPSAASTPRRAGPSTSTRAPRSVSAGGRSSTSATTAGSSCRRASNGARRRRPAGTLSAAAARAGCRGCSPARPPRGCTRGRRRSRPGRDRPHRIWPWVTPRSYASRGSRSAISAGAPNSRDLGRRPEQRHDDTPAGSPFTRRGARGRFGSGSSTTASSREARAAASSGSQPDSMSAAARQWRRRAASARRPSTSIAYWIPR